MFTNFLPKFRKFYTVDPFFRNIEKIAILKKWQFLPTFFIVFFAIFGPKRIFLEKTAQSRFSLYGYLIF